MTNLISVPKLAEGHVTNIITYLQANLAPMLDAVAAASPQLPIVSLENPRSWFVVEKQQGYALPAVFVLLPTLDFRIKDRSANFINAEGKTSIVVWVEDQDEERLTYKAWRYMSAIHATLDQADIISSDGLLHLKPVIYSEEASNIQEYVNDQGEGKRFRKALLFRCATEHLENYA